MMDASITATILTGAGVISILWQRTADLKSAINKRIDGANDNLKELRTDVRLLTAHELNAPVVTEPADSQ